MFFFSNVDHIFLIGAYPTDAALVPTTAGCQHLAEFGRSEDIRVTKRKASWLPDCGTANLTYMTCEHEEHVHESCQHQTTYLHEKLQILRDLQYRIDKSGKSKLLTHQNWTKYGSVTATSGAGCLVQCFLSVGNSDISLKDHPAWHGFLGISHDVWL